MASAVLALVRAAAVATGIVLSVFFGVFVFGVFDLLYASIF